MRAPRYGRAPVSRGPSVWPSSLPARLLVTRAVRGDLRASPESDVTSHTRGRRGGAPWGACRALGAGPNAQGNNRGRFGRRDAHDATRAYACAREDPRTRRMAR
jgi:hypothetical protein